MNKTQLRKLYIQQRLSMMQIAGKLGISHATVLYWMKKYKIQRRSWSESTYAKLNPDGDPFAFSRTLTPVQRELLIAALLLFLAEGSRKDKYCTNIGNLDGRLLQVFMRFLREVGHVNEKRISVFVRVHKRFSLRAAKRYWTRLLLLPEDRVFVYRHTDIRSQNSQQWSPNGLAILSFHNTKFKRWFDTMMERYIAHLLSEQGNNRLFQCRRHGGLLADNRIGAGHDWLTDEGLATYYTSATQN